MKLYATTTSERASKGQGGNKALETVFLGEINGERRLMLQVAMRYDTVSGLITLRATNMLDDSVKDIIMINTQGKPKGYNSDKDTLLCVKRGCGAIQGESEYCEEHEVKGKSQKGEKNCEKCNKGWPNPHNCMKNNR